MANFSAADVKKLRELTGAGMMDCKKALDEADGDFDKAVEILRIKGGKKMAERAAEREASAGLVATSGGALVELNCETDFVAKADKFIALGDVVLRAAVASGATDVDGLLASEHEGRTLGDYVTEEGALLGEKVAVRRLARVEGAYVDAYLHKTSKDLLSREGKEQLALEIQREAARPMGIEIAAPEPVTIATAASGGATAEDAAKAKPRRRAETQRNPIQHVHFSSFIIQ